MSFSAAAPAATLSPAPSPAPTPPSPPAPSEAPAAPPARPRRSRLRRVLRVVRNCVIGYVVAWLIAVGGMLGLHAWFGQQYPTGTTVAGISNVLPVDDQLWRGAAPGMDGYRELADRGVNTVVDLRADHLSAHELAMPERAGLDVVRLPIRDGQTPTQQQVDRLLQTVKDADGPVFVHCGAGVGRTGSITAAYLVETGQADSQEAAARALAVGPPSIEQVYYMLTTDADGSHQPPQVVEGVSRLLDAPRRIASIVF